MFRSIHLLCLVSLGLQEDLFRLLVFRHRVQHHRYVEHTLLFSLHGDLKAGSRRLPSPRHLVSSDQEKLSWLIRFVSLPSFRSICMEAMEKLLTLTPRAHLLWSWE